MTPTEIQALDPGVRGWVCMLRAHGFTTTDSGDGVSKPAEERVFDRLHVIAVCPPAAMVAEADRMRALMGRDWRVEASYCPNDGRAILLAIKEQVAA